MRPIKFRGISYESNQWVYGGFYEWNDKVWIVQKDIWDEPRETEHTISSWLIEVDPKTVGQYTGLKDKNGKEIYEGDVIKYSARNAGGFDNVWIDCTGVIIFERGAFQTKLIKAKPKRPAIDFNLRTESEYCEIIGNICEGIENDSKEIQKDSSS